MRVTFILCFLASLFINFSYGQAGSSCSNAQSINLNQSWSTLQGGTQGTAYYRFQAANCGYLYICTRGNSGDIASDCSGGRYSRQSYQSACANGGQILLYRMEEQTTYFLRVAAGASADFSFLPNEFACVCNNDFSDCRQVSATPQTPTQNGDVYSCHVNASFSSTNQLAYWEVNGQRQQASSSSAILTANQAGNTLVCATYLCNRSEYKCCQQVVCPPAEANVVGCTGFNRWADILRQPWFVGTPTARGILTERYCGQSIQFDIRSDGRNSVIGVILGTGTTEYLSCDGQLLASCTSGGCNPSSFNPNRYTTSISSSQQEGARPVQGPQCETPVTNLECTEEDFNAYTNSARIAEQSDKWITWRDGFEGAEPDAYLFKGVTSDDGFLYVLDENPNGNGAHDVVYILEEERTGVHHLSMRVFVSSGYTAYFNIQPSNRRLRGGGIWKMIVEADGQATISVGNQTHTTFGFPANQWIDVLMQFDLDSRSITSFVLQDGRVINTQAISYPQPIFLGGVNFYAYEGARFWVDNINSQCSESVDFFRDNANISRSKRPSKAVSATIGQPDAAKTPFTGSKTKKPVPNLSSQGAPGAANTSNRKIRQSPARGNRSRTPNRSQKIKKQ